MIQRNAFVTGAGGFVGGHLVRELLHSGWSVTGLIRRPEDAATLESSGARVVAGDLRDPSLRIDIAHDAVVFHLAAALTTWVEGVDEGLATTRNLIRLMADHGAGRLMLVSSAAVHRPSHDNTIVDENLALGPHPSWHHYAHQKLAVEELVIRARDEGRLTPTIIRPTRVLGPGDRRLVLWATKFATGVAGSLAADRDRRHPVVVAGELARGLVACAESPVTAGRAYYLSSAIQVTKGELIDAFMAAGMPIPRRPVVNAIGVAAVRAVVDALDAPARSLWPSSTGPRRAMIAALERRAGMPVGHDCVISSGRAAHDFGWRGMDDIGAAIAQAVEWDSNRIAAHALSAARPVAL